MQGQAAAMRLQGVIVHFIGSRLLGVTYQAVFLSCTVCERNLLFATAYRLGSRPMLRFSYSAAALPIPEAACSWSSAGLDCKRERIVDTDITRAPGGGAGGRWLTGWAGCGV